MILTSLTFLFLHTLQFVHPERSQDLSQESGMRRIDKTLIKLNIIYSVIYKLTRCSRSNREIREGSLICSSWLLTGRGIRSEGMRNLVNIIDGAPDGPVMNKHHTIDDKFEFTYQWHLLWPLEYLSQTLRQQHMWGSPVSVHQSQLQTPLGVVMAVEYSF